MTLASFVNGARDEQIVASRTAPLAEADVLEWFDGAHPVVVVTSDEEETPLGFARTSAFSANATYAGVFDCFVYVEETARTRSSAYGRTSRPGSRPSFV